MALLTSWAQDHNIWQQLQQFNADLKYYSFFFFLAIFLTLTTVLGIPMFNMIGISLLRISHCLLVH